MEIFIQGKRERKSLNDKGGLQEDEILLVKVNLIIQPAS